MFHPEAIFVALLLFLSLAVADTSLYIPGFDEQPVSVSNIGVDSDGRTTWQIQPGKPTGTVPPAPFPLTVTMVQGPSDAVVHASLPQFEISLSCALSSSMANCIGDLEQGGQTITTSLRETMKPFLVQGGGGTGPSPQTATSVSSYTGPPPMTVGSAVMTAATGFGVLVGSVFAGMATLFLI